MVFLQSQYLVLLISSNLFLMMMMMNLVFAGPTGLTLKLIHIDSPESPLYPGRNLTQVERMERAFQHTKTRQQQLTAAASMNSWARNHNNSKITPNTVRPRVHFSGTYYMAVIGIGTFRNRNPPPAPPIYFQNYYFIVDTASDLLWLQCEECDVCFQQDAPLFPWKTSMTYNQLRCNSGNPFCKYNFCFEDFCGYNITYGDGSNTIGTLATEKLTVNADNDQLETIGDFVFGCGIHQQGFDLGERAQGQNEIVGILGLGGGPESFIRQLGARGQMRFEYCLKPWNDDSSADTFLRFGSDTKIAIGGGGAQVVQVVQTTPIVFERGDTIYYVIMYGISVDGTRIGYDLDVFIVTHYGTGGCIFDSGAPWTIVSSQVFDPLKKYLIEYFRALNIHACEVPKEFPLFELCFERPNGFDGFPTITFHFTGGGFELDPAGAFFIDTHIFCLNILRSTEVNSFSVIFGALQQANHRILYDLKNRSISWSKENCAANS